MFDKIKPKLTTKVKVVLASLVMSSLLAGCNDSDNDYYKYQIKVQNLTNGQPMSPVAIVFHDTGKLWEVGTPASNALEVLAESGDNSQVLGQSFVSRGESGAGVIMPGMSESIEISFDNDKPQLLSIATMLVNTNDAFTGVNAVNINDLRKGESISLHTRSYDAGTEENSELASTIPGPAAGGEGYNSERDDIDLVGMHAGVVSSDDGLTQSVLTQAHRFSNPTLLITVSRLK